MHISNNYEIKGYYKKLNTDKVYEEGIDEKLQDHLQEVKNVSAAFLDKNKLPIPIPVSAATVIDGSSKVVKPLSRSPFSWWWMISFSPYYNRNSPSHGVRGCGGHDLGGKEGPTVALIFAIVALVASAAASVGLTAYQGFQADKVRKEVGSIKKKIQEIESNDQQIHKPNVTAQMTQIYKKVLNNRKAEWRDLSAQTAFSAVLAAGFGLLTIAAAFALYAYIKDIAISPLAKDLAIAGGAGVGGAALGYGILLPLGRLALRKRYIQNIEELEKILNETLPEAQKTDKVFGTEGIEILKRQPQDKLYYQDGNRVAFKDKTKEKKYWYQEGILPNDRYRNTYLTEAVITVN